MRGADAGGDTVTNIDAEGSAGDNPTAGVRCCADDEDADAVRGGPGWDWGDAKFCRFSGSALMGGVGGMGGVPWPALVLTLPRRYDDGPAYGPYPGAGAPFVVGVGVGVGRGGPCGAVHGRGPKLWRWDDGTFCTGPRTAMFLGGGWVWPAECGCGR
jgi:hypothetical protein